MLEKGLLSRSKPCRKLRERHWEVGHSKKPIWRGIKLDASFVIFKDSGIQKIMRFSTLQSQIMIWSFIIPIDRLISPKNGGGLVVREIPGENFMKSLARLVLKWANGIWPRFSRSHGLKRTKKTVADAKIMWETFWQKKLPKKIGLNSQIYLVDRSLMILIPSSTIWLHFLLIAGHVLEWIYGRRCCHLVERLRGKKWENFGAEIISGFFLNQLSCDIRSQQKESNFNCKLEWGRQSNPFQ